MLYYLTNYTSKCEETSYNLREVASAAHEQIIGDLQRNDVSIDVALKFHILILVKLSGRGERSINFVINELLGFKDFRSNCIFENLNYNMFLNFTEKYQELRQRIRGTGKHKKDSVSEKHMIM